MGFAAGHACSQPNTLVDRNACEPRTPKTAVAFDPSVGLEIGQTQHLGSNVNGAGAAPYVGPYWFQSWEMERSGVRAGVGVGERRVLKGQLLY